MMKETELAGGRLELVAGTVENLFSKKPLMKKGPAIVYHKAF
jgi:hypothetical protein